MAKTKQRKSIAEFEQELLQNSTLITPEVELPDNWPRKYGTEDKTIAQHRKGRQEIIRDLIASQRHHERFAQCVDKLEHVDTEQPTAGVEITKWAKSAELHLKAMGKYVPDLKAVQHDITPEAQAAAVGVSRAAAIIERIAGGRIPGDDAQSVQARPVVSTQVRTEPKGS